MTIFGKILIITNLLITTVFVYLASVDWAKRYSWAYAVYRDDLRMNGLPIDEREMDPIGNVLLADKLSSKTLEQVFQQAGAGAPVETQVKEVQRAHEEVRAALAALDEPGKRALLKIIMLPLARTTGDRYEVQERIDKAPIDDLLNDVSTVFTEAAQSDLKEDNTANLGGEKPLIVKQLLPRDRRQAIAHLLYNIKPTEEGHARTIVVVGLKAFNEEAKLQADNLEIIFETVRYNMLGDRANFEVEYRKILDEIRDVADSISGRQLYYENQQKLEKEHTALRDGRQKDVDDAKAALKAALKVMNENLKAQAKQEESLFESQRILGTVASENERKEKEIRRLEKLKPAP